MKFIPNAILPPDLSAAPRLNAAAEQLEKMLTELDYKQLGLSDYGMRYYAYDLRKLRYMLQSYVFMLLWAQYKTQKQFSEMALLDHGGGIGMLSLLAKLSGCKTVIHQDLNPVISQDAARIAEKLGVKIDYFITGDTPDFVAFVNKQQLNLNVIGSRNVIEHVYDLDLFFKTCSSIQSDKLLLFLSTTANEKNPLVNWYTKKLQRNFEYKGNPIAWGEKKLDPENSGFNQRKKIILQNFPELNATQVNQLSKATRGRIKADIIADVKRFLESGNLPIELKHPTNTCSPESGGWVENLVSMKEYKHLVESNGFQFDLLNGFYNQNYPQAYLNAVTPLVNFGIKSLGRKSTFLAPFISILAQK